MSKPVIADTKPLKVQANENETLYWCSCGRSKKQPFCDGSHQGTGLMPVSFTPEKTEDVFLCQCKHTKNPPFCDGAHSKLK